MNREARLRKAIPGAPDDLIAALAAKPAGEVDVIVAALRQARRDALDHEKARRHQRRADARSHRWYDERELADRNVRMLSSTGRRATEDLAALESLATFSQHTDSLMRMADWWCYPLECGYGHPWAPGRVTCVLGAVRLRGGAGRLRVRCAEPGCRSVW